MRYVVRREFFGGLVYDRVDDVNFVIDEDFYNVLKDISENNLNLDEDTYNFLMNEQFFASNNINYKLIDSGFIDNTLSAPGRVHFYYTNQCNLNCAHCFTKGNRSGEELSFNEKINMLDQMEQLGVNEILIGGGEPFVKDDFPDFVEESLKRNIITKVFTNGLLLNDSELVKRMSSWNLKYLSISIDGYNEEEYEYVRGIKGLKIIKHNLERLKKECKFTIAASITVNANNYKHAKEILALIYDMGFDRLKVRPVKPAGNVWQNKDIFPGAEQYVIFIKDAQNLWNLKYRDDFTLDFSWGDTRLIYDEEKNVVEPLNIIYPYEGYGCFAGKVNIVFDSAGNALTCGFLPDYLSSSFGDNLRKKVLKKYGSLVRRF